MDMEMASERKRQSILRTELAWMQRGARARSTKQKGRIQRFEALRDKKGPVEDGKVEMESISSRLGRTTIEISDLCKSYGDKVLVKDYTYFFLKDDRIGYIGPNGSGKSTLMKMIAGKDKGRQHQRVPDAGAVFIPAVCPVHRDRETVRRREKTSLSFKDPHERTECPDPGRADE